MNGCVIPNTPIAVDFWKIRECPHVNVFLLTHLHGDHVVGLTSSWNRPIYCSDFTGQLLVRRYGVRKELICALEIGSPTIVYLDSERTEQMTLTALDANHCPGSVMFLLEGYFGRILHTGDFRWSPAMMAEPPLSQLTGLIDTVYLDNTYCNAKCVFPTREEATETIINIIASHPHHDVVIGLRNLGKEDLLLRIAEHFQENITVPFKIYETFQVLGKPHAMEVAGNNGIQVVPFQQITNTTIEKAKENSTIFILPTAMYLLAGFTPYERYPNVFVVNYSDHSSYQELINFVSTLRPQQVIPIVQARARGPFGNNMQASADMTCFSEYLRRDTVDKIVIPASVKSAMLVKQLPVVSPNVCMTRKKRKPLFQCNSNSKKVKGVVYTSPLKPTCSRTRSGRTFENAEEVLTKDKNDLTMAEKHLTDVAFANKGVNNTMAVANKGVNRAVAVTNKVADKVVEVANKGAHTVLAVTYKDAEMAVAALKSTATVSNKDSDLGATVTNNGKLEESDVNLNIRKESDCGTFERKFEEYLEKTKDKNGLTMAETDLEDIAVTSKGADKAVDVTNNGKLEESDLNLNVKKESDCGTFERKFEEFLEKTKDKNGLTMAETDLDDIAVTNKGEDKAMTVTNKRLDKTVTVANKGVDKVVALANKGVDKVVTVANKGANKVVAVKVVALANKGADKAMTVANKGVDKVVTVANKDADKTVRVAIKGVDKAVTVTNKGANKVVAVKVVALANKGADKAMTVANKGVDKTVTVANKSSNKVVAVPNKSSNKVVAVPNKSSNKVVAVTNKSSNKVVAVTNKSSNKVVAVTNKSSNKVVTVTNKSSNKVVAVPNKSSNKTVAVANEGELEYSDVIPTVKEDSYCNIDIRHCKATQKPDKTVIVICDEVYDGPGQSRDDTSENPIQIRTSNCDKTSDQRSKRCDMDSIQIVPAERSNDDSDWLHDESDWSHDGSDSDFSLFDSGEEDDPGHSRDDASRNTIQIRTSNCDKTSDQRSKLCDMNNIQIVQAERSHDESDSDISLFDSGEDDDPGHSRDDASENTIQIRTSNCDKTSDQRSKLCDMDSIQIVQAEKSHADDSNIGMDSTDCTARNRKRIKLCNGGIETSNQDDLLPVQIVGSNVTKASYGVALISVERQNRIFRKRNLYKMLAEFM